MMKDNSQNGKRLKMDFLKKREVILRIQFGSHNTLRRKKDEKLSFVLLFAENEHFACVTQYTNMYTNI